MKTQEQLYNDYRPLILNTANFVSTRTGLEFDEAMGQANLIFFEITNKIPQGKTLSVYLKKAMRTQLFIYANKWNKQVISDAEEISEYANTLGQIDKSYEFFDFYNSISQDGQIIIDTVMYKPEKIMSIRSTDKKIYGSGIFIENIKTYFHANEGWTYRRVSSAISEIKKEINTIFY